MSARCPLPSRASFRDLLRDLLARPVTIRPGPHQQLDVTRPSYIAGYRFDDGRVAAAAVADLDLSIAAAAAIGAMPPTETRESVEAAGGLAGDLFEFLHEVVNVSAKLLNSPTTPHVAIRDFAAVPGEVPADLAELATSPQTRTDWVVGVDGYGEGGFTVLG